MADAPQNLRAVTFPSSSRRATSTENILLTEEDYWSTQNPSHQCEINQKGEYVIWTHRLELLTQQVWYDVKQVLHTLTVIRNINFGLIDDRQQALADINALRTDCPFAKNIRFPKHRVFMCEAESNWAKKFDRLRSALLLKSMQKLDDPRLKNLNESLEDFHETITELKTPLLRHEYVYTRDNFEEEKGLTWVR